ncbi:aldehyde dehydrogenase family protein, partial [Mycolicibacterium fortuitum]|uniref:aldehyde dehydrogenase family protein n=1 Tax=Mycolicibacterium fortuitum TaxID=1766 RepID=UPI0034CFECB5
MPTFEHDKLFIDGRWTTPSESGVIDVVNPATENVIGHVPNGSAADVDAAVTAARRAFDPLISVAERRERLGRP